MFKNATIYKFTTAQPLSAEVLEETLQRTPFVACGATQERSEGWVPPRGEENGALVESVAGQLLMRWKTEAKQLPGSVLARKVQEKCDAIEKEYGRKPGKKEKADLRDEAKRDLLPQAFTKLHSTWVWIDRTADYVWIDSASQSVCDCIVSALVESIKGLGVALLDTQTSPQAAMAHWLLTQEAPAGFTVDRECELKAVDESKAVVKYGRHPLDIDEVRQHVEHGKLPTKLALTWDDRVSFVLDDQLHLRKIAFLDAVLDEAADEGGFDTDVTIFTSEMSRLLPDLIEALGGEGRAAQLGVVAQADATTAAAIV